FARAPVLPSMAAQAINRLLGAKEIHAREIRALTELLVERDSDYAQAALSLISRRAHELSEKHLAALRAEMGPLCRQILSRPNDPLYVSAKLLSARLQLDGMDGAVVRRKFLAAEEP